MTLQSCFCLAIAQVYNNEGEKAFLKKDYSNVVYFVTEGIKVNCKDEYGMAILYSNRANAHLHLGELMCCCCCFFFCEYWAGSICNPAEVPGLPFALANINSVATNLTPCL